MRLLAHILAVLALMAVAVGSGTATAATTTADPAPKELWRAYPLKPGHGTPSVRLPASSAALRPPATAAAHGPSSTDGGGSPGWPIVVVVGAMTLLFGLLAGRRVRRPQTAGSAAAAPAAQLEPTAKTTPAAVEPTRAQAAPVAARPAPTPAPSEPFAMPTEPRRTPPEPRPAPAQPRPAALEPPPAPAQQRPAALEPPQQRPAASEPHPAPPEPVAHPQIRRFRRVPWPPWSQALWRCEITHHYGVVHADLRLVAHEPGRNRGAEVLRTATHTRPGWGAHSPHAELVATVRRIGDALLADGWEPVRTADDEAPQRFFWPREGRPPLDGLAALATTDREDEHDS